jgi:hypothetical protein
MRNSLLYTFLAILCSCTIKTEVEGIRIGNSLSENQDFSTNKKFIDLIHKSINRNADAFAELLKFECGGAAGCYDLGSVITQIVYRTGERDFLNMVSSFSREQKSAIRNYLEVGLEYGYSLTRDTPNKSIESQFPMLIKTLEE